MTYTDDGLTKQFKQFADGVRVKLAVSHRTKGEGGSTSPVLDAKALVNGLRRRLEGEV